MVPPEEPPRRHLLVPVLIVAVAALIVGGFAAWALITTGSSHPAKTISAPFTPPPVAVPSPTPVNLTTNCTMGFLVAYDSSSGGFGTGGGFYPDNQVGLTTADNAEAAIYGSGYYPDYGGEVKITNNTGTGVTLNEFTVTTYDAQGTVVSQHPVSGFDMPRFLAPGESDSFVLKWSDLPGAVNVSTHTYLHSTCKVSGWQ